MIKKVNQKSCGETERGEIEKTPRNHENERENKVKKNEVGK